MEETKIYIRERFTRSGRLQCRTAVLPEECGFGGKRTVLVVSGNEFDDFATVVPLIPTGHNTQGETYRNGSHVLITVDDQTYTALCDYPVTVSVDTFGCVLGYPETVAQERGIDKALVHHFMISKEAFQ